MHRRPTCCTHLSRGKSWGPAPWSSGLASSSSGDSFRISEWSSNLYPEREGLYAATYATCIRVGAVDSLFRGNRVGGRTRRRAAGAPAYKTAAAEVDQNRLSPHVLPGRLAVRSQPAQCQSTG